MPGNADLTHSKYHMKMINLLLLSEYALGYDYPTWKDWQKNLFAELQKLVFSPLNENNIQFMSFYHVLNMPALIEIKKIDGSEREKSRMIAAMSGLQQNGLDISSNMDFLKQKPWLIDFLLARPKQESVKIAQHLSVYSIKVSCLSKKIYLNSY